MDVNKAMMDTNKSIKEYEKEWFAKVEEVSTSLFKVAEDAVEADPDLNVVIVKRPQRFDRSSSDMLGIKSKLSEFGNQVYDQLWLRKGSPEKIHMIEIDLVQNSGYLKDIIYGNHENPRYDGIHFKGSASSRHFTYRIIQKLSPLLSKPNPVQPRSKFSRKTDDNNVLPARAGNWRETENHSNCPQAK